MSTIGKNIRKIRTVKKLSQASFAELFNLARPSVGAYEEERAEPKIETVIQIANYFGISIDSLLTKELTINELYKFDLHAEELSQSKKGKEITLETLKTIFVSVSRQVEYLIQLNNKDFISNLPKILIPGVEGEKLRAFEMGSEEMHDNFRGLNSGDIILGQWVKPDNYTKLENGLVYIFVLNSELIIRRYQKSGKKILLNADNPNYDNKEIDLDKVIEIWEVQGFFSKIVKPPSLLADRIMYLENTVQKLEQRLGNLENKNGH